MSTRDELRVRLHADIGPYTGPMKVAERATQQVVQQTDQLRQTAVKASGVAMGLSESLVVVTGSSTAAARGLTAVNVASKALALTPAGAAMTALGFGAGILFDELQKLKPEVEDTDKAFEELAKTTERIHKAWATQITQIDTTRQSVKDLRRAYDEAWLPREQQLVNELSRLRTIEYAQEQDLQNTRERAESARDYAAAQARLAEREKEYLETLNRRVGLEKELSAIHDREEKERSEAARRRREAADRELASVISMAQKRGRGATEAAQKEEAERQQSAQRQAEALRAQIQTARERLEIEQQVADTLRDQMQITEEEHRRRTQQLNRQRNAMDVAMADFVKRLEDTEAASQKRADELRARVQQIRDVTGELLNSGVNALFAEWTRDLEGAQRVAAELLRTITQIAAQALVAKISESALSAGSGADWPKFAAGGLVHGPGTGTSDSVVARLSRGEFVVRAAAVERMGVSMLEAINGMRMPRFAAGGQVGGGQVGEMRVTVANFFDEDEIERFLSSRRGEQVVRNVMRRTGG